MQRERLLEVRDVHIHRRQARFAIVAARKHSCVGLQPALYPIDGGELLEPLHRQVQLARVLSRRVLHGSQRVLRFLKLREDGLLLALHLRQHLLLHRQRRRVGFLEGPLQ